MHYYPPLWELWLRWLHCQPHDVCQRYTLLFRETGGENCQRTSTAAKVAFFASSTRNFLSSSSTSVAAPTCETEVQLHS